MKLDLTPLLPARGTAAWLAAQLHHPDATVRVAPPEGRRTVLLLSTPELKDIRLAESRGDRVVFEPLSQFPFSLDNAAHTLMKQFAREAVQAANDALADSVAPLELPALTVTGGTPQPARPAATAQWAAMLRPVGHLPYALLAPSKRAAQLLGCETLLGAGVLSRGNPAVAAFERELNIVHGHGNGPTQALYDAAAALHEVLSTDTMNVGPVHPVNDALQP